MWGQSGVRVGSESTPVSPSAAPHVVIVGGGISGLAAALRLADSDRPPRVTVLEAAARFGGRVGTERRDGWLVELGPDLFLGGKPGAWELCRRLGIAERLHGTTAGAGAYVLRGRRLFRVPQGLTGLVPSRMGPFVRTRIVSPLGKLRVALDYFIPPRRDDGDESVEAFVVRRLGREMYERLVEPLLSGIFAGDGSQLSVLATFPQLRESERTHGGMLRAMLAARRVKAAPVAAPGGRGPQHQGFLSLPGGLGELIDALVTRLGECGVALRSGSAATALERDGEGWQVRLADGSTLRADAVIVAAPTRATATLLDAHAPDAAAALREIPLVTSATVSLGYRTAEVPRALDGTGYVTPRIERRAALACTWSSSKFPGRAPEGHALFRVFLGGATRTDVGGLSDDAALAFARQELREVMGVTAEPRLAHVMWHREALPQYTLGHRDRVRRVEAAVELVDGLEVAGNSYHGVGIPDCVVSGERAAERLLVALATLMSS